MKTLKYYSLYIFIEFVNGHQDVLTVSQKLYVKDVKQGDFNYWVSPYH